MSSFDEFNKLAEKMDNALDSKDVTIIENAIDEHLKYKDNISNLSGFYYVLASAYSRIRHLKYKNSEQWNWNKEEYNKEILYFRKAINCLDYNDGDTDLALCTDLPQRLLTEYGNTLSHYGRFVEATEQFKKAVNPKRPVGMAFLSNVDCIRKYSGFLYDNGHQQIFLSKINELVNMALKFNPENGVNTYYAQMQTWLSQYSIKPIDIEFYDSFSLGRSKKERQYRKWCVDKTLFLNPLNDLFGFSIVAQDVLGAPSIVYDIDDEPYFHSFYNQIKQEYVSARWLLFDGLHFDKVHYSDRRTMLHETYDFGKYCLAIEKVKASLRIQYSIFDKIAFFIVEYFQIDIKNKKNIYFRNIWYKHSKQKDGLLDTFKDRENLPLLALFRMSMDFAVNDMMTDFNTEEPLDPLAKKLLDVRNRIEHGYLKIVDYKDEHSEDIDNTLTYDELVEMSMDITKKARAALIYLSLAIHHEEKLKKQNNEDKILLTQGGDIMLDRLKKL